MMTLLFPVNIFASNNNMRNANPENEYNTGINFFRKKDYSESFPIFSHLCNYESYLPACVFLGRSYAWGYGVNKDPNKALQIYRKYSKGNIDKSWDKDWKDVFQFEEASTLEYASGDIDDVDKAIEIYKSLTNSEIDWIKNNANEGLTRLSIYILMVKYLCTEGNYFSKKIDYEKFRDQLNEIELGNLPYDIREKFTNMRNSCLKYAKDNDSIWSGLISGAVIGAKVGVNAAMGDFAGAGAGVAEFFSLWSDSDKTKNECVKNVEYFYKEIEKYKISHKLLDNQYNKYYPKSK